MKLVLFIVVSFLLIAVTIPLHIEEYGSLPMLGGDDDLLRCDDCGATFTNDEVGRKGLWSHCCHIDQDETEEE